MLPACIYENFERYDIDSEFLSSDTVSRSAL